MKITSLTTSIALSAVLIITTALVYWPGLSGDFLFDDFQNIVTNSAVHAETINLETLRRAAKAYESGTIGRPLATISFAINYVLDGKNAWGYKFGNLLIHLINCLLIFALSRRLTTCYYQPKSPRHCEPKLLRHCEPKLLRHCGLDPQSPLPNLAPFAIALLWAIHPLQISSVLYIVQRMEILALTFILLALLAYLHGRFQQQAGQRGRPWLLASVLLAGIGLLSKETAVLFPAYTLALELTVLGFAAKARRTREILQGMYGVGVVIALALFTFVLLPKYAAAYAIRDFNLEERLFSQLRILVMYLGWIFLPLPNSMSFYYDDYQISHGWLDPITTLFSGLLLLSLLMSAWLLRKRMPLYALGIFWFFVGHLLTSAIIPLELVYEHRNYFPLFGILLALAALVNRIQIKTHPLFKTALVSVIITGCALLSVIRAATWGDPLLLATDLVAKNPHSTRAISDLATLYISIANGNTEAPLFSMGMQEFERAANLPDSSALPEQSLIITAATFDQPVQDIWWERLFHKLQTQAPGTQASLAITGLFNARAKGVDIDPQRIARAYAIILERIEQPPIRYVEYAKLALDDLHDAELAGRLFTEAVARNPKDVEYALKIAGALLEDGHSEVALAVINKAQELKMPDPQQQFSALKELALKPGIR